MEVAMSEVSPEYIKSEWERLRRKAWRKLSAAALFCIGAGAVWTLAIPYLLLFVVAGAYLIWFASWKIPLPLIIADFIACVGFLCDVWIAFGTLLGCFLGFALLMRVHSVHFIYIQYQRNEYEDNCILLGLLWQKICQTPRLHDLYAKAQHSTDDLIEQRDALNDFDERFWDALARDDNEAIEALRKQKKGLWIRRFLLRQLSVWRVLRHAIRSRTILRIWWLQDKLGVV